MSTPFRLQIPRLLYEAMILQAIAELPNECCGLLAGRIDNGIGRVARRYPLINEAASPREYLSESRSLFAAHRDMHQRSLEVLAIYHSHPTSEPVPSRTDLERNYSAEVVNLIISLKDGEPKVRGWWLTESAYREAEWELVEENQVN